MTLIAWAEELNGLAKIRRRYVKLAETNKTRVELSKRCAYLHPSPNIEIEVYYILARYLESPEFYFVSPIYPSLVPFAELAKMSFEYRASYMDMYWTSISVYTPYWLYGYTFEERLTRFESPHLEVNLGITYNKYLHMSEIIEGGKCNAILPKLLPQPLL